MDQVGDEIVWDERVAEVEFRDIRLHDLKENGVSNDL